ncbi:MAG: response regulator [Planctomycetota bacterium]
MGDFSGCFPISAPSIEKAKKASSLMSEGNIWTTLPNNWRDVEPSTFRILVADDHADIRLVLGKSLGTEGYQMEEVTNGVELLQRVREEVPDLIILDIMMPELDGLSALEVIRGDEKLASCYVILLTGRSTLQEKLEGFNSGADDYITKPYSLVELKARVRAGIRIKAMQRCLQGSLQIIVRQEKMATIGVLAAGLAHEFNNIMGGISGYAQLAKHNPKFTDRLVQVALEQSERAKQITTSLSSFAHNAATKTKPAVIGNLIDAAICLLKKDINRRGISLEVKVPEDLRPVMVNTGQMQQVFLHLLLNAIQAIGNNGKLVVSAAVAGSNVIFKVEDSGSGVPAELRTKIFDPFFTTKGPLGSSSDQGTGLGLAYCQNIIQGHGGTLTVEDSEFGGACFRIVLPAATPRATEQALKSDLDEIAEKVRAEGVDDESLRVIYVEDDVTLQDVVTELFAENPPVIFSEGPAAVNHCREENVDVVILDLTLRGPWNGWKVLKELKGLAEPPPVILTTGSIVVSDRSQLDYPRLEILPKPFELAELEKAVERVSSEDEE